MLAREEGVKSSGSITSSGVVTTANTPGLLYSIILRSGSTATRLDLRNGGSGGTILATLSNVGTTAAGDTCVTFQPDEPISFSTDIYATIAGTNAEAFVFYKQLT